MSSLDTFKVFARCRPLNDRQIYEANAKKTVSILDSCTLSLSDSQFKENTFQLDGVFTDQHHNQQIFEQAVLPLADNFLNGINSTIFAYGITGAGKSHTMFGNENNAGLIPLAFEYLLRITCGDSSIKLGLSYLQIYNEQIYDLLADHSQNLQITEDPNLGIVVNDLTEIELVSMEQANELIAFGNERRVVAQTKANQFSSRSHAIVIITTERTVNDEIYTGKFSLVDLAGSQKQSVHHETRGIRSFEGSNINRSLLTLGNCINLLSEKRKAGGFIPYRDSKLTRLLKDSLGGNTKTVMIACISQSTLYYDETINTLKYACRANKIEKVVHQNIKQNRSLEEYKKQNMKLRKENEVLKMKSGSEKDDRNKENRVASLLEELTSCIERRICGDEEASLMEAKLKSLIMGEVGLKGKRIRERMTQSIEYQSVIKKEENKKSQLGKLSLKSKLFQQEGESVSPKSRVNLQNLREKVKVEKKKFNELMQAVKTHTMPIQQIKKSSQILLNSCQMLSRSQKEQLNKLKEGRYYEFDAVGEEKHTIALRNISKMAVNVNPSRNRHLATLQKIMGLTKKNASGVGSCLSQRSEMQQSIKEEGLFESEEDYQSCFESDYSDLYA